MPEHDTSNLPILDDIIQPGDADKAARPKARSALPADDPQTETSSDTQSDTGPHTPAGDSAATTGSAGAHGASAHQTVMAATAARSSATRTGGAGADGPVAPHPGSRNTSVAGEDLDGLIDEIMRRIRPGIERLLRQTIRQTLEQRFSAEHDPD